MARKGKPSDRLAMQNACKTLLANIRFASIDGPIKTVTVTSTSPSEGKSTIAFNLAQSAATAGMRTIVVECDMRHRTMAGLVGVRGSHGLYSVLSGRESLDDAIVSTSEKNLDFLDVEPGIPNPPDVLASKRFRRLVSDLRADYDYVIFDTPPVGAFVDAAVLASITDGTLFVLRENFTKRELAVDAVAQLRKAGANVLGTVLNYCEHLEGAGYYEYYGKEGSADTQFDHELPELPRESHARMRPAPKPEASRTAVPSPAPSRDAADEADDAESDVAEKPDAPVARSSESAPKPVEARRAIDPSETAAFVIAAQRSREHVAGRAGESAPASMPTPAPAGGRATAAPSSPTGVPHIAPARPATPVQSPLPTRGASRISAPLPAFGHTASADNPYARRK